MRFVSVLKWVTGLSFLGTAGCWGAYEMIGSSVDEQGFLHEPFALVPIGWLFLIIGVGAGVTLAVSVLVARHRTKAST